MHEIDPKLATELEIHRVVYIFLCHGVLELDDAASNKLAGEMLDGVDPLVILHEEPWYWFLPLIERKFLAKLNIGQEPNEMQLKCMNRELFIVLASFLRRRRSTQQLLQTNWEQLKVSCERVIEKAMLE
jgi:hypothetical protein